MVGMVPAWPDFQKILNQKMILSMEMSAVAKAI